MRLHRKTVETLLFLVPLIESNRQLILNEEESAQKNREIEDLRNQIDSKNQQIDSLKQQLETCNKDLIQKNVDFLRLKECKCHTKGTIDEIEACDDQGKCRCKPRYSGDKCDMCENGFHHEGDHFSWECKGNHYLIM